MLVDCRHSDAEQNGDEFLSEPDGFVLDTNFDAFFPGLRGEDEELGGAVADLEFFIRFHGANGFTQRRQGAEMGNFNW